MDIESTIVTETRKEVRRNWRSSSKQTVRPRWVALFRIIGSDSRLGVGSPEETRTIRMRMISPVTREMKQFLPWMSSQRDNGRGENLRAAA